MLEALKFVIAATARKDYAPELCHIEIKNGRVTASDGIMSLSAPIPVDLHVLPHAKSLMTAVNACPDDGVIALHVTRAGKLGVKSGTFKAFVNCLPEGTPFTAVEPEGVEVLVTPELLTSIKALEPFMAIDASRPWAMAVRIGQNSCMASNNVVLVEKWHGAQFPHEIVLGSETVKALVKINEAPERVMLNKLNSITFFFPGGRWLKSQLVDSKWPENITKAFPEICVPSAIPEGFFESLETLRPFIDDYGRVYLLETGMTTCDSEGEGASVDLQIPGAKGVYHLKMLQLLDEVAKTIDFTMYPKPCPFFGEKLRGIIVGIRT